MTYEHPHPQPGAGHLTFATGAVVSGDPRTVEERTLAGEYVSDEEIAALQGTRVEIVDGISESEVAAYNAAVKRAARYIGDGVQASVMADPPAGARIMPSGHWVMVRDPRTLTRGDKRTLLKRGQVIEGQSAAERIMTVQDLMHQMLITAWSYPHPLPSEDLGSLDRLPLADDGALDDLLGDANALLFPKAVSPDDHADPTSPTAPSGE